MPRAKNREGKPHHLTPYRRHARGCKGTKLCECPMWAHGRINGSKLQRISLNTRSEEAAKREIHRLLHSDSGPDPKLVPIESAVKTVESAVEDFLKAKEPPNIAPGTHRSYENLVNRFAGFFTVKGAANLRDITPEMIRAMFAANAQRWKSQRSKIGSLKVLRLWLNFAVESKWIAESPAKGKSLSFKNVDESARTPWVPEEIDRILDSMEMLATFKPPTITAEGRARVRALITLLFAGGQRISDATFIRRSDLDPATGLLNYRVIKTRRRIEVAPKLHRAAVDTLLALPGNGTFFFWDGDYSEAVAKFDRGEYLENALPAGMYRSHIWVLRCLVMRVLKHARVDGSPHTFRDCFAVNLLEKGVPFLTVSKMLGHKNVQITEKHYLNIVKSYRDKMSQSTSVLTYLDRYVS